MISSSVELVHVLQDVACFHQILLSVNIAEKNTAAIAKKISWMAGQTMSTNAHRLVLLCTPLGAHAMVTTQIHSATVAKCI
jgi:hypothetical protein